MEFRVCSKSQVRQLTKVWQATHVVGMLDPGDKMRYPMHRLAGTFLRNAADVTDPAGCYAPTKAQVKAALDWVASLPEDSKVVVHCFAGVSRSTALALAFMASRHGVEWAKNELEKYRPMSYPNELIARYADEILGFNGELLNAAQEICNSHDYSGLFAMMKENE